MITLKSLISISFRVEKRKQYDQNYSLKSTNSLYIPIENRCGFCPKKENGNEKQENTGDK